MESEMLREIRNSRCTVRIRAGRTEARTRLDDIGRSKRLRHGQSE